MIKTVEMIAGGAERIRRRRAYWRPTSTAWFLVDATIAYGAMRLAFAYSPSYSPVLDANPVEHATPQSAALLFGFFGAVTAHIFGLHNPLMRRSRAILLSRCVGTTLLAVGLLSIIVFAVMYNRIGRLILFQAVLYTPLFLALARIAVWQQFAQRKQRLLFLGAGKIGRSALRMVNHADQLFEVVAFVDHDPIRTGNHVDAVAVLGTQNRLSRHCNDLGIDEVISCVGRKLTDESLNQVMECLSIGVPVRDYTHFIESNFFQVPVEYIQGEWFLHADLEITHPIYQMVKRGVDIFSSLIGLALSSPLLFLAAMAIKLESEGPALYSQIRVGHLNQPFRIWKLRTMRVDAEKNGAKWASKQDERVLWTGKILRKTRLDEVPQFWNILSGEMSLVGPRPERPEFVEELAKSIPFYQQRHLVKPGLTGWAQISYRYGASVEDALMKLRYDLYYIKHASVGLDFQIMLRTIGAVMKGAR